MTPSPPPRPIRACLLDMDGLLINTEDLITESINAILQRYGRSPMPGYIRAQLQGRHLKEASDILLEYAQLPITFEEYQTLLAKQHCKLFPTACPLPGVVELLDDLASREDVVLALVTSSSTAKFQLKTSHLHTLFSCFPKDCQILGDDPRLGLGKGKPEPDSYLLALDAVNARLGRQGKAAISPAQCLVFEDSVAGVKSGRRAGMQIVWCPHHDILREYSGHEDEVLDGEPGGEFGGNAEVHVSLPRSRWSADGWARLLATLENFPAHEYFVTR